MRKVYLLLCAMMSMSLFAQTEATDNFNSYSDGGTLNGNGGWVAIKHSAGGGNLKTEYVGGGHFGWTTPDESIGVFFDNANTNYGEVATHKSTPDFYFDFSTGGVIEIEIDMVIDWWGAVFGIGYDADGDGVVLPPMSYETTQPNPNLPSQDGGIYFVTTGNDPRPMFINGIVLPNNTLAVDFDYDGREWTRWKLMIDLEANNGQGSVALFADFGCTGEFEPITECQGINAGLTPGSGDRFDPAMWDGVFFLSSSIAGWDNITVRHIPAGLASQFINFPQIPDMLTDNGPIQLDVSATSSLPVTLELLQGPATLSGNTLTLTGEPGVVKVKASQPGDGTNWQPAPSVTRTFEVVDPSQYEPQITLRRPYDGSFVYAPTLDDAVILVLSAYIEHGDVIKFEDVSCNIDGETVQLQTAYPNDPDNGYWYATWIPKSYGETTMTASITQSGGKTTSLSNTFTVTDNITDIQVTAMHGELVISPSQQVNTAEYVFPSHVNAFNDIRMNYEHSCVGACDTYDRVGYCRVKNHRGEWVELYRYVTPFGVECDADLDVSDYSTVLQGLVEFEVYFQTWQGDGYNPTLTFNYTAGTPEYKYIDMNEIWFGAFDFGDYANQQPVPEVDFDFPFGTEKANLKIITTGHNWSSGVNGCYNTGNAAEFLEATHNVFIDNQKKFEQHNWEQCNPNPYGCQPQNGTWTYPRSGWCPGALGMVWDFNIDQYLANGHAHFFYQFDPSYIDECHPNFPDCVNGQNNCPNCTAADNPILRLSGKVVCYSNSISVVDDVPTLIDHSDPFTVNMLPNPAHSLLHLSTDYVKGKMCCHIVNLHGQEVRNFVFEGETTIDISDLPSGIYLVNFIGGQVVTKKLIIK